MDILRECVSVKTATREGPFNLQCKYLSINGPEEEEEEGQWGSLSIALFLLLLFESGKRLEQLSCVP